MTRFFLLAAAGFLAGSPGAAGETVAWWRFEDGLRSEVGAGELTLAAGEQDQFFAEVPGPGIRADGRRFPNHYSFVNGAERGPCVERPERIEQTIQKSSFTIEALIKLDTRHPEMPRFQRIIGNAVNEEPGGWSLMIHEGKLRFFAWQAADGKGVTVLGSRDLADNRWHHVAVVGLRDGDTLAIQLIVDTEAEPGFVDIKGDAAKGLMIQPLERPCLIGGYNRFYGWIDEVRISDKALSADEFLKPEGH